jgi:hypothetical protein
MTSVARICRTFSALFALTITACAGAAPSDEDPGLPKRPATEETPTSPSTSTTPAPVETVPAAPAGQPIVAADRKWTWVPVEGTRCMDGSETGIGVNLSDTSKDVVIVLEGGGACFDELTCTAGTIHQDGFDKTTFSVVMGGMGFSGILNRNLSINPLRDWNYVFVPYCTGDVHAGNNPNGPGHRMHVGFENIRRDLQRIVPTFAQASRVVLTGSSAGGVGAGFNYDQVQRAFGETPVLLLDDSGPVMSDTYLKPCVQQRFRTSWNMDATLPVDCKDCRQSNGGGLINMARYIARTYPKSRFAMISGTTDAVMRTFFSFGYSSDCKTPGYFPPADFEAGLMEFRTIAIAERAPFHVFYPTSSMHTWLLSDAQLLTRAGGVTLADWIERFVEGAPTWTDALR